MSDNQDLRGQLNSALKESMKSKQATAVSTVRLILAALKDRDLTARAKGKTGGISDDEILSMLQTMIKQRNESMNMYRKAGREELAAREEQEIVIIKTFMPKAIEGHELEAVIDQAIKVTDAQTIKDMGKIMGVLKEKYTGQIDMAAAGAMIKTKLG